MPSSRARVNGNIFQIHVDSVLFQLQQEAFHPHSSMEYDDWESDKENNPPLSEDGSADDADDMDNAPAPTNGENVGEAMEEQLDPSEYDSDIEVLSDFDGSLDGSLHGSSDNSITDSFDNSFDDSFGVFYDTIVFNPQNIQSQVGTQREESGVRDSVLGSPTSLLQNVSGILTEQRPAFPGGTVAYFRNLDSIELRR